MLCVFLPPLGEKKVGVGERKGKKRKTGLGQLWFMHSWWAHWLTAHLSAETPPTVYKADSICLCLGCYCSFTVAFDEDVLRHRWKSSELFCQSLCVFKLLQVTFSRPGANYLISGDLKTVLATCGLNPFKTLHLGFTLWRAFFFLLKNGLSSQSQGLVS